MSRGDIYYAIVEYASTGANQDTFLYGETSLIEQLLGQFELPRSIRTPAGSARSYNLQTLREFILQDAAEKDVSVLEMLATRLKEFKNSDWRG